MEVKAVVKRVHMQHHPKDFVNDYEADKIIEVIGPDIAFGMIKAGKDRKVLDW
jgi:hypothetical protein